MVTEEDNDIAEALQMITTRMRITDRYNGQERLRAIAAVFGFMVGRGYGPRSAEMADKALDKWDKVND